MEINVDQLLGERQREMTDKQVAIIKAAVEIFGEKGFAATSTREIAQRAQVAEGTVFKQYATKEALFLSITQMVLDRLIYPFISTGLAELSEQNFATLESFLDALLANRLALIQSGKMPLSALKLVVQELPYRPEIRLQLAEMMQKVPLEAIVIRLQQLGLIKDWPPMEVGKILVGSFFGLVVTGFLLGNPDDMMADVQYWKRFVADGLGKKGDENG